MDKKCFVITPISQSKNNPAHTEAYWTEFFEVLQEIMEENGFSCVRSETGPYKIFAQIVQNIEACDVAIAVLTDLNANVWYELGIRHTLRQGTIMLMEKGQELPFDIKDYGVIFYEDFSSDSPHKVYVAAKQKLKAEINQYLQKLSGETKDSPVRGLLQTAPKAPAAAPGEDLTKMRQMIELLIEQNAKLISVHDQSAPQSAKSRPKRVLWVDDYPSNNASIVEYFRAKGVEFDFALNTAQGLSLYDSKEYDLIITDMGRNDDGTAGLTLLAKLWARRCTTPRLLFASDYAVEHFGPEATRLGASGCTYITSEAVSMMEEILKV